MTLLSHSAAVACKAASRGFDHRQRLFGLNALIAIGAEYVATKSPKRKSASVSSLSFEKVVEFTPGKLHFCYFETDCDNNRGRKEEQEVLSDSAAVRR